MGIDLTRPGLFRSIFYFLLLYALFRARAAVGMPAGAIVPGNGIMPPGEWLVGLFEGHPLWREAVLPVLSLLNAFYITRILLRNMIYPEHTYVPALVYGMVALGYTVSALTIVPLTVAFLLIFAIDNMIRSYKKERMPGYFLHASVALGLAAILYAPAAGLVLLLPVGLVLFRQPWRSVVTALLGVLLPVFLCSYVVWGMGGDFWETSRQLYGRAAAPAPGELFIFRMQPRDYAPAGIFFLLSAVALTRLSMSRATLRRRSLRGHTVFIWTLILCLAMAALPGRGPELLPVVAVPLAALIPLCFSGRSGWRSNLLFALMIGSVVGYNLRFLFP